MEGEPVRVYQGRQRWKISREMKRQERNKSHHLSRPFIENSSALCVTFNNSFVLWEGGRRRGSPLSAEFPDSTKKAKNRIPPPFLYLILLFIRWVTGVAGNHSSLSAREMKTKTMFACTFSAVLSSSVFTGTRPSHTKDRIDEAVTARAWLCCGRIW